MKPSEPYAFSDPEDGMCVLGVDCLGDGPEPGLVGNGRTGGFDGEIVEVDVGSSRTSMHSSYSRQCLNLFPRISHHLTPPDIEHHRVFHTKMRSIQAS
jgi:hypothetical protein